MTADSDQNDDLTSPDPDAIGYQRHWAPVLAPSVGALLDRHAALIEAGAREVLDIGAGTGNLALTVLRRWPSVRVSAIDAAATMLDVLRGSAEAQGDAADRLTTTVALAAGLPFDDGRFDLALSSFVFQLVPDRPAALRETHRVLRPGGTLGYVTWLADERPFAPDRVFEALLSESGFDEPEEEARPGDLASPGEAARELREAGFDDVVVEAATLRHAFSIESYIAFLVEFDEASTFDEFSRAERRRFLIRLREGLMALSPGAFEFVAPIVFATGRRPASGGG